MYKLILFLGLCSAFDLGSKLKPPSKDSEKIVGCYYRVDVPYNDPQPELEKMGINASICSHIFYSFAGIDFNGSIINFPSDDDIYSIALKNSKGHWEKNTHIKNLADLVDCSGYNENILVDPLLRKKIVNSVLNFVKKFLFDGIILDLGNSKNFRGPAIDKKNLVLLLKALKEKFDEEDLILFVSVDPTEDAANRVYDIKGISTYVNFINLEAFNLNIPLDQEKGETVSHSSPLFHSSKDNADDRKKNIDYVVTYWIKNGVTPNKLTLGTFFRTGSAYILGKTKQIGRGTQAEYEAGQDTFTQYSDICTWPKQQGWKYFFDNEQKVAYLYKGNEVLPYDDVASIKAKAEYVNKMELGGAVVVEVADDDVEGKCGEKFALMKTLNQVLRSKA